MWWTGNIRYFLYFVREVAGIVIGICAFIFITATLNLFVASFSDDKQTGFFIFAVMQYTTYVAFAAAIIHTLTWLHAMPRIMPFNLSKTGQVIAYIILLIVWAVISWLTIITVFPPTTL